MAELSENTGTIQKGKKPRMKKESIRMDMTPMVDLAFLLLTFFMLANSFTKHTVMEIRLPEPGIDNRKVNIENVLFLYPQRDHKFAYRMGTGDLNQAYLNTGDLKSLLDKNSGNNQFWVMIKPDDRTQYDEIVDIFDRLNQAKIQNYSLKERDNDESRLLANL
jgi:biopolymer transport protein ExbD